MDCKGYCEIRFIYCRREGYALPGEPIDSTIERAKQGGIIKLLDTVYNEEVLISADTADLTIVGPVTFGADGTELLRRKNAYPESDGSHCL